MFTIFDLNENYYTIKEFWYFIQNSIQDIKLIKNSKSYKNKKQISYYNVPAAFDIETSNFSEISSQQEIIKTGIMYIWQLGINGRCLIGRTWEEFKKVIDYLIKELKLDIYKRLVIYVHNLEFEFEFICKHFKWEKVFANDTRKPIYAVTTDGIEFRCSYLLSGYSLAKVGENLTKYKIKKLEGFLDYNLIRHSKTELTDNEISYCINDIKVVMAYIQELIEENGSIVNIPLTKTGFVRRYCKKACLYGDDNKIKTKKYYNYRKLMNNLTLTLDEYKTLKNGFIGGFTHANAFYTQKVLENVASYDFNSSYPYVMVSEKFPMSRGKEIEITNLNEFQYYLERYCCLMEVKLTYVKPRRNYENYISYSQCKNVVNPIINNGRIVYADSLEMTITEQDFMILKYFYYFDMEIGKFIIYEKDYLPTDFIKSIIKLYADKTTLKGIEEKQVEYMHAKEMLNSCYGMCVTDICRDNINYTENWIVEKPNYEKSISDYNKSQNRFLFYAWGIWVTAYARRNLFTGIMEFKGDYIYSDTDSIKVLNHEKHQKYFEEYNKFVERKLKAACKYHNIPYESVTPKTIKGKIKVLGIWDFEGIYTRFKTLGAKRYMVETIDENKNRKISFTVSGCNKKLAIPYLLQKYGIDDIFEYFDNYLDIPADYTSKMTHTYIDEERKGIVTDYKGVQSEYYELSCLHLEKAPFTLNLSEMYLNYIKGIKIIEE